MRKIYLLSLCMILACQPTIVDPSVFATGPLVIPSDFPAIEFPADNAFTEERWLLGKQLFYDQRFSVDQSVSCASCHQAHLAFSDGERVSSGVAERLGERNAPSLANIAYHPYYTREGGVPSLEMQVLVPIQEHVEFDFNILLVAERLAQDSSYQSMSQAAYDREMDFFVITRALATFERSLISGNSLYDLDNRGVDGYRLSAKAKRGKQLFFSERTACASCHGGFNFTNYAFQNNGLYEDYPDPGRFRLTNQEADRALFKVASLRNVGLTAPYMHDGSMATLEAVIEHYNEGGKAHPHKSELIKPLGLSKAEKAELLAFLHSLSDPQFITDPKFLP
ncbi:MAG: cytochrome-c peroxidase [Bacteroidia bacterium]